MSQICVWIQELGKWKAARKLWFIKLPLLLHPEIKITTQALIWLTHRQKHTWRHMAEHIHLHTHTLTHKHGLTHTHRDNSLTAKHEIQHNFNNSSCKESDNCFWLLFFLSDVFSYDYDEIKPGTVMHFQSGATVSSQYYTCVVKWKRQYNVLQIGRGCFGKRQC